MAPLAMAVMSMVGSAGTAVAAGASSLAGAASAAVAGSSALTLLQGGMTVASVLGSLAGGGMDMMDAELQGRSQSLQAEREALAIREETLKKIGDSRVAFGASGVTLASSSPVEDTLYDQAEREINLAQSGGRLGAGRARIRGQAGMLSAVTDAIGTGANFAASVANRG